MNEKNNGFMKGINNFLSLLKKNSVENKTSVAQAPKNFLENVKEQHSFVLKNGEKIDNLTGLFYSLQKLDYDVYNHHVNDEKHDFASWIEHCVEDKILAQKILNIKEKDDLTIAIGERVRDHLINLNSVK